MKQLLVYKPAQIRLAEIWDYTLEKWGEEQADSYLRELGVCMNGIASQRHLWCSVQDKRLAGVFFVRYRHHFIFFREMEEQIAVISILHENMDIVQRLRQDAAEPLSCRAC
jgi:toxin ParE1/3/4